MDLNDFKVLLNIKLELRKISLYLGYICFIAVMCFGWEAGKVVNGLFMHIK